MRVLLVDDAPRLSRLTRSGLEALGFSVALEHDGLAGFRRAREGAFDAIVLDILLPGMNGYDICSRLREAGVWTPILMLTAKDGEWDEADALDAGADDYLRKPFSLHVLAARLRALVRRGAAPRPVVLQAGSLTLDPAARVTTRRGTVVGLTRREFDLLEALLLAQGSAVAKSELLERVWGRETDGTANANLVEVYVRYLRAKLDEPFGVRTIETVRGYGYRLVPDS